MMLHVTLLATAFLIPLTWCYSEEVYPIPDTFDPYPDDDAVNDIELRRRNSNFLRFGRANLQGIDYDDYNEDFARPTRSGKTEKNNDHFIRFGRGRQDFLRFGRAAKDKTVYLRFGRSVNNEAAKRRKRETFSEFDNKRSGSNYMRFGRNSNFMRFGRLEPTMHPGKNHELHDNSPLIRFLAQLLEQLKTQQPKTQY